LNPVILFSISLHRVASVVNRYDLLLQCFLTEQLSAAQLQEYMKADDVFRLWVEKKLKERARAALCG
jgi:hypothetical protein